MKLTGKVAIITGGGRGLGRASAIAMAKEGASVVILSRTPGELKETARAIGKGCVYLRADVSRPGDIGRTVERALSAFGRIDILMNNAAVVGPVMPLHEMEKGEWDRTLAINLDGVHMFSRSVLAHMMPRRSGKIINVTSGLGEMVMPPMGAYSITKGAVIHLTQIMAAELQAHNIQVNGLDPGVMDTRMQDEVRALGPDTLGPEVYSRFREMKEKGYLKSPEQAASLAVFLASGESDPLTGLNGTATMYQGYGFRGGT